MWNSRDFNPTAPASHCHTDFATCIDCSYHLVADLTPATPQKIEDIFTSIRSDLLRIITRWEQSGQGEGGVDADDAPAEDEDAAADDNDVMSNEEPRHMGALTGRPARALNMRYSFLNGKPSYLLYYWEVADTHQLLVSSLQRLNNATGATDGSSTPSATMSTVSASDGSSRSHRSSPDDQQERVLAPLAQSITYLADCQRQMLDNRAQDRQHEKEVEDERIRSQIQLEEDRRRAEAIENSRKRKFERRTHLLDVAREYRRLTAELRDEDGPSSRRKAEFYRTEGLIVEEEIRQLEQEDINNP
jgi:hypothetical protein